MRFPFIILFSGIIFLSNFGFAQTKETKKFYEDHPQARAYYFYKSVIRMIDFTDSDEYFDMVKGIEKAVLVNFDSLSISDQDLLQYKKSIENNAYEEAMTFRRSRGTASVYIKEDNGKMEGLIVFMKADSQVFILDIIGKVELSKLMDLTNKFEDFKDIF